MSAQSAPAPLFNKTGEKATSFTNDVQNMNPLHFILPFPLCRGNNGTEGGGVEQLREAGW